MSETLELLESFDWLVSWLKDRMAARGYGYGDRCTIRKTQNKREDEKGRRYYVDGISVHPDDAPRIFFEVEALLAGGIRVTAVDNKLATELMERLKQEDWHPVKPTSRDLWNDWFPYYDLCKKLGIKYTLDDLAKDAIYEYGSVRNKHAEFERDKKAAQKTHDQK